MIYLLINHKFLSYNGYYKIINSANIKKLSQYRKNDDNIDIGLVLFYIGRVYDFIL
jgi:hypothetical protein